MQQREGWAGSLRRLIVLASIGCFAGAALAAQEPASPQAAADADAQQVEKLIEATKVEARKFRDARPQEPWETSAARKQVQALWEYGRERRTTAAGAQATSEALRILQVLGRHAELTEKVEVLGPQEPVWSEVTWVLLQEALASGNFDPFLAKVTWVANQTQDLELRGRLWFTIGRVHREQGRMLEAEAAFQKVTETVPGSDLAASADGAVYEMYNLNPGLPAPAFTATPLTGQALSLDKLRGKVVVLDFWGST